jgi:hypothetical protein
MARKYQPMKAFEAADGTPGITWDLPRSAKEGFAFIVKRLDDRYHPLKNQNQYFFRKPDVDLSSTEAQIVVRRKRGKIGTIQVKHVGPSNVRTNRGLPTQRFAVLFDLGDKAYEERDYLMPKGQRGKFYNGPMPYEIYLCQKNLEPLVRGLCGKDGELLTSAAKGLREVDMAGFGLGLNIDEIVQFAAAAYKIRQERLQSFAGWIQTQPATATIFETILRTPLHTDQGRVHSYTWINELREIPEVSKRLHARLSNKAGSLAERVQSSETINSKLRQDLAKGREMDIDLAEKNAARSIAKTILGFPRDYA